ncbi:MAG: phosphoribosylformylglycinamidine synthase subunit PurQ [Ilumatobacteraceae bacterium]
MRRPCAVVIAGPGTNRDPDTEAALELAGSEPRTCLVGDLTADPALLSSATIAVVAGGFSYGDALGAGRLLALDLEIALGEHLAVFVERGGLLLGICNGFQVLTRAGLLPGSLTHNDGGHFICDWVELAPTANSVSIWTAGITDVIHAPIAHGEGRWVHPDPQAIAAGGQVALRYHGCNPNGSVDDVAGVCDATGRVLGLMPHPENHIVDRQHPNAGRIEPMTHLGLRLFQNAVEYARG